MSVGVKTNFWIIFMTHTDLCFFYNQFIFIEIPIMRLCLLRITATQLVSHMYEQDEMH